MFPTEHSVPAQLQRGNLEVRRESPDIAEDGSSFTLIEELLWQVQQAMAKYRRSITLQPWMLGTANAVALERVGQVGPAD